MIRIIGSIVIKNEIDRYLEKCILHAKTFLDEIFVYDDRSVDGSAQLCADLGCNVVTRPFELPSFIEHEGQFRYGAWRSFEETMKPDNQSWVFSFDADEFMVTTIKGDIRQVLDKTIFKARKSAATGVMLHFPEIFKIENNELFYRVDGFWNTIKGPRLFAYKPNASWKNKSMGCGSEPTYVANGKFINQNNLKVLHLGYAKDEDKKSKYERYSSLEQHGHNNSHIESIIKTPILKKWEGNIPGGLF
jgi:glycosyltransferase involved in cell wall biosynthesis